MSSHRSWPVSTCTWKLTIYSWRRSPLCKRLDNSLLRRGKVYPLEQLSSCAIHLRDTCVAFVHLAITLPFAPLIQCRVSPARAVSQRPRRQPPCPCVLISGKCIGINLSSSSLTLNCWSAPLERTKKSLSTAFGIEPSSRNIAAIVCLSVGMLCTISMAFVFRPRKNAPRHVHIREKRGPSCSAPEELPCPVQLCRHGCRPLRDAARVGQLQLSHRAYRFDQTCGTAHRSVPSHP
jgi:hypothetical protein